MHRTDRCKGLQQKVKVHLVLLMLCCQASGQLRGSIAGAAGGGRHIALEGIAHAVVALWCSLGPQAPILRLQLWKEGVALYVCINLQGAKYILQDASHQVCSTKKAMASLKIFLSGAAAAEMHDLHAFWPWVAFPVKAARTNSLK